MTWTASSSIRTSWWSGPGRDGPGVADWTSAISSGAHGRRSFETVREIAPHLDPEAEVRWLAEAEEADMDDIVSLPGAAEALGVLTANRRAIVTSGGRVLARRRLEFAGLPVPDIVVAAEDVSEGKPSAEGYLAAARRLGANPERCQHLRGHCYAAETA